MRGLVRIGFVCREMSRCALSVGGSATSLACPLDSQGYSCDGVEHLIPGRIGGRLNRRTSVAAALVSAACFGTLAIFTSLAYAGGAQPLQLLTWRFALAALILGGYVALTRPRSLVVPVADIGRYAVISIGGYGAASICFFFALTYADASVVAIDRKSVV